MSLSDEALIARTVKKQDQQAFAQLVLRYQSRVRLWTRRLCGGDVHLADDLAQETFIKVYAALPAFRGDARFSTWLYRITFNTVASRWRGRNIDWCELAETDMDKGWDQASALEVQRDVAAALEQLSEPQQIAIRLCYEEGFSHGEIAEIMAIPLGTVKTHILRGKQKLERLLSSWSSAV